MELDYYTRYYYYIQNGYAFITSTANYGTQETAQGQVNWNNLPYIRIPSGLGGRPVFHVSRDHDLRTAAEEVIIEDGFSGTFSQNYFTSSVKRIYFPASTKIINSGFERCKNLEHIFFNGDKPELSSTAFPVPNLTKEIPVYYKVINYYNTSGLGWSGGRRLASNISEYYVEREHRVYPPYFDLVNSSFTEEPYLERISSPNPQEDDRILFYDRAIDQAYNSSIVNSARSLFDIIPATYYMEGNNGYEWELYKSGGIMIQNGHSDFPFKEPINYSRDRLGPTMIFSYFDPDDYYGTIPTYNWARRITNVDPNQFYIFKIKNTHGEYSGALDVRNLLPEYEYTNIKYSTYYFPSGEAIKQNVYDFNVYNNNKEPLLYCSERANALTIALQLTGKEAYFPSSNFSLPLGEYNYTSSPFANDPAYGQSYGNLGPLNCSDPVSQFSYQYGDPLRNTGIFPSEDYTAVSEILAVNNFDENGVYTLNTLTHEIDKGQGSLYQIEKNFPEMYPQLIFMVAEDAEYLKFKVSVYNKFRQLQLLSQLRIRANEWYVDQVTVYSVPSKVRGQDYVCASGPNTDYSYWDIRVPISRYNLKGGALIRVEIVAMNFFDIESICSYPYDPTDYTDSDNWPFKANLQNGRGGAGGTNSCLEYNQNRIVDYPWIKNLMVERDTLNLAKSNWVDNIIKNTGGFGDGIDCRDLRDFDYIYTFPTASNNCESELNTGFHRALALYKDPNNTSKQYFREFVDAQGFKKNLVGFNCTSSFLSDRADIEDGAFSCLKDKSYGRNGSLYDCSPIGDFRIQVHDIQAVKLKKPIFGFHPTTISFTTDRPLSEQVLKFTVSDGFHDFNSAASGQKIYLSRYTGYNGGVYGRGGFIHGRIAGSKDADTFWLEPSYGYSNRSFTLRDSPRFRTDGVQNITTITSVTSFFDGIDANTINGVHFEVTGYKFNSVSYSKLTEFFTLDDPSPFPNEIKTGFSIEFLNDREICPEILNYVEYFPYEINGGRFKLQRRYNSGFYIGNYPVTPSKNIAGEQIRYPNNEMIKKTDQFYKYEDESESNLAFAGYLLDNRDYTPYGFEFGPFL